MKSIVQFKLLCVFLANIHNDQQLQRMKIVSIVFLLTLSTLSSFAQRPARPIPGAQFTYEYVPMLQGKRIGLLVNQTSMVSNKHLVDTLISLKLDVRKIYGPEHGFRGQADAGEKVKNSIDSATALPVISLYGNNKKPSQSDLDSIDIVIFDIQDVGVRFYTYISSLHYMMEACAERNIPMMILDRPNPNGHYIDGPILSSDYKSFVGMHPVPVVYGMTIAEYARMINGEKWLAGGIKCELIIIRNKAYNHQSLYSLPVKPSPNLGDADAIALYPSLCFFEGTVISVGRGTYEPFKLIGHPALDGKYSFSFQPVSIEGMSKEPPYKNQNCYGIDLRNYVSDSSFNRKQIELKWLIEMYKAYPDTSKFFNNFFDKLAGSSTLRNQILEGKTEEEIRMCWRRDLIKFNRIRRKYLLYR